MTGTTEAPFSILSVGDAERRTTLLTPYQGSTLLLEKDFKGDRDRLGALEISPLAAAQLAGRTYLFDERGISVVTPRADRAPDAEVAVEDFQEFPARFQVEAATTDRSRGKIVAIGFDGTGALATLTHDGARTTVASLPFPPACTELGGQQGGARATIHALGADRLLIAVRDSTKLYFGVPTGSGVDYGDPIPLDDPIGAPVLVRSGDRLLCYQVEGDGSQIRRLRSFTLNSRAPLERAAYSTRDVEPGLRSIGIAETGETESNPSLFVSRNDRLEAIPLLGEPSAAEAGLDFVVLAWNAQEPRFFTPLVLHLIFYTLLSVLARRRPSIEPRIVIYRPAPLLRRLLAAVSDTIFVSIVTLGIFKLAGGAAELAYFATWVEAAEVLATSSQSVERLSQNPIFASLLLDFVFLGVFLLTMLHACGDGIFGRTLGKHLFGLRVMSLDGDPPSIGAVATRALLMILDFVYTPFIGISFILFSKRRQRLGDLFSGTVVVEHKSVSVRKPTPQEVERARS